MAIKVEHIETGKKFILIGTGYGAYKSAKPSFFGGNLFPDVDKGEIPAAAVCDQEGSIYWFNTTALKVVEIDGQPIADIEGIDLCTGEADE